MNTLKQHIQEFQKRGIEHLQKRQRNALTKISDNIEALNRFIKTREYSAAMSEWTTDLETTLESPSSNHASVGHAWECH